VLICELCRTSSVPKARGSSRISLAEGGPTGWEGCLQTKERGFFSKETKEGEGRGAEWRNDPKQCMHM
jgi:hypothetical protein